MEDLDRNLYGKAYGLDQRGRHASLKSAVDAVVSELLTEKNAFFDTLADKWDQLFPGLPARPGRYEDGKIFIYVRHAAHMFSMRPRMRMVRARLAELPGAPQKLDLRLEVHSR